MGPLNGPNPQGVEESMETLIRYNTLGYPLSQNK